MWKQALDLPPLCVAVPGFPGHVQERKTRTGSRGVRSGQNRFLFVRCSLLDFFDCHLPVCKRWLSSPSFRTKVPGPDICFVSPQGSTRVLFQKYCVWHPGLLKNKSISHCSVGTDYQMHFSWCAVASSRQFLSSPCWPIRPSHSPCARWSLLQEGFPKSPIFLKALLFW